MERSSSQLVVDMEDDHGSPETEQAMHHNTTEISPHEYAVAKRRLKELQALFPAVANLVLYMKKRFKKRKPPPWLDLRVVAYHLMRSPKADNVKVHHMAYRAVRVGLDHIKTWMGDHWDWKRAAATAKMPYLGERSEILAAVIVITLTNPTGTLLGKLMDRLEAIQLHFLLDDELPADEAMPAFWRGAMLMDPAWRSQHMVLPAHTQVLPFHDDLNYLVLTVICRQKTTPRNFHGESVLALGSSTSCQGSRRDRRNGTKHTQGNEVLAVELSRLLGKRPNQDITAHREAKRQRLAKDAEASQQDIDVRTPVPPQEKAGNPAQHTSLGFGTEAYDELKKDVQDLQRANSRLKGDNESLREQTGRFEDDIKILLGINQELHESHTAFQEQVKLQNAELKEQIRKLEEDNKSLRIDTVLQKAGLEGRIQKTEEDNKSRRDFVALQNAKLVEKIDRLEERNRFLRDYTALQTSEVKQKVDKLEEGNRSLLEDLTVRNMQHQEDIKGCKQTSRKLERDNDVLRTRMAVQHRRHEEANGKTLSRLEEILAGIEGKTPTQSSDQTRTSQTQTATDVNNQTERAERRAVTRLPELRARTEPAKRVLVKMHTASPGCPLREPEALQHSAPGGDVNTNAPDMTAPLSVIKASSVTTPSPGAASHPVLGGSLSPISTPSSTTTNPTPPLNRRQLILTNLPPQILAFISRLDPSSVWAISTSTSTSTSS
ncbi:hypothetical protein QBC44DRAFT_378111 [Cladorrhinum sp. PSN332]|nr:hypothetical protein QBC44DRAFT_378111 [Cladorrhinum sp. PSN332]